SARCQPRRFDFEARSRRGGARLMLLAEISDLENERQHHDEDESQRKKQPAAPVGEFIKGFGASLIDSGQYLRPVVDDRVERGRIERVDLGPRKYKLAAGLVQ